MGNVNPPYRDINLMLNELDSLIHRLGHEERKQIKSEIKNKKNEINKSYSNSAATQGKQGTLWKISGTVSFVVIIAAAFVPPPYTDIAKSLPNIGEQFTKGFDSNFNGHNTEFQGKASVGQKELEVFHSRLQEAGKQENNSQELLRNHQRSTEQAARGG